MCTIFHAVSTQCLIQGRKCTEITIVPPASKHGNKDISLESIQQSILGFLNLQRPTVTW